MDAEYDLAVIGGGQAGIPLALTLARAGRKVALIEQKDLGGSCVNFGCTPTKAALASARIAHWARRAGEYGVKVGEVSIDFAKVLRRAREIGAESRASLEESFSARANPRLIHGHARLAGRDGRGFRLAVEGPALRQANTHLPHDAQGEPLVELRAREVVLDTGTRSLIPAIPGLEDIPFLHSENWLEERALPAHLLIIGAGYIGLEMAQFYRRMGSEVSVVDAAGQIAGDEDRDIAESLQAQLAAEGVRFRLNTRVARIRRSEHGVIASFEGGRGVAELEAAQVFVAAGRVPNTDGLGLESVGLGPSPNGTLAVDGRLSTTVPGLWAVGDIRGGPMFTHTSWDDYRIVESQMIGDGSRTLDRVVPYAIFTDPELGRVGISERDARQRGLKVKIGRFQMRDNGKAKELGESAGFIKVVVDADSGLLLGAALLCTDAAELVHLYVELMNARAPSEVMARAIHIHPTLAEALQSAVATVH